MHLFHLPLHLHTFAVSFLRALCFSFGIVNSNALIPALNGKYEGCNTFTLYRMSVFSACCWDVVSELLVLLCLYAWPLISLLKYLYPSFLIFTFFGCSPHPTEGGC